MPLTKPEEFGADQSGYRVNDFCRHCYANGAFTEPGISMDGMLERCVRMMDTQGIMPAPQARAILADVMPRLKRWRTPAGRA